MNSKKETVRLVVILFTFCAIGALILAVLNSVTEPKIKAIEENKTKMALREVAPTGDDFEKIDIEDPEGQVLEAYYVIESGERAGKCILLQSSGFGGPIKMMVGVTNEGVVTGVNIISLSETPGLGTKAGDEEWLGQFVLKTSPISVVKGQTSGENDVSAISGATVTSAAVAKGVENAIAFAGGIE